MRALKPARQPAEDAGGVLLGLVTLDHRLSPLAGQLTDMAQAIEGEQQRELAAQPAG